nr:hypothetical protein [Tanacetum cinerariifolium]
MLQRAHRLHLTLKEVVRLPPDIQLIIVTIKLVPVSQAETSRLSLEAIHRKGEKRVEQVTDIIVDTVKLKLTYVKFKKSARVDKAHLEYLEWKLMEVG